MASTMKDIARETGLSLATISKYLNGGNVREKNRLAIEKSVSHLDFRRNEVARSLKTRHSRLIGFVIPELSNIFVTTIINASEIELRRRGYAVMVCDCNNDPKLEEEAVQFLVQKGAEALVNMPVCAEGTHLQAALSQRLPVVLVDRMLSTEKDMIDYVLIDNMKASFQATTFLMKNGHRRIGIVVGPRTIYTSQQRLLGYFQALLDGAILPDDKLVAYSDYTIEGGYKSMLQLLESNRDMTGVFVTNYEMTLGALLALNELKLPYPEKLSFIGFDNMLLTQFVKPKPTIVTQPLQELGKSIAGLLMDRLENGMRNVPGRIEMLNASLQAGDTVTMLGSP